MHLCVMKRQLTTPLLAFFRQRTLRQIDLLDLFAAQNDAVLLHPAENGGWSIAQCLEHLNRYGDWYLPRMRKAAEAHQVQQPDAEFRSTWLGAWATRLMDPDTGKRKFPAFKAYKPAPQLDGRAVLNQFRGQLDEMLAILKLAESCDLEKAQVGLSEAEFIKLRLGDTLAFMIAHNERHVRQADRCYNWNQELSNERPLTQ